MTKPLAIIPTYLREAMDLRVFETALSSLRATAGNDCDVLVVDDGSPAADLVEGLKVLCDSHNAECVPVKVNAGFSRTVNVGLRRCLVEKRDAVLVNSDIQFGLTQNWLEMMTRQTDSSGEKPASIVGALLLYPSHLIQHGGIYFSFISREFGHRFQFGPGNLPEAQIATECPCTGALQFIRYECMEGIGLYDESFRLAYEDVDFGIRAWLSGRTSVYQPGVRAIHHESFTRGRADEKITRWTNESWLRFVGKYADVSFAAFVPDLMMVP